MNLWQRLFLAFALLTSAVLGGFVLWQQYAFRHDFRRYLDDTALSNLDAQAPALAAAYAAHGGWDFLRDDPGQLGRWLMPRLPPLPSEPPHPDDGPPHPHPPLRVLLVDAAGARVAGDPRLQPGGPAVPLQWQGQRIGTLWLAQGPGPTDEVDRAFANTQRRTVLRAGVAALLLALLAAWGFARMLLAPLASLAAGTRALAAGDFARRLPSTRRDELGRLARDFNQLASTLEGHREARRQWGVDIAHELRTPLGVLRGEIQALQDGVRQPDRAALASLEAECLRLTTLVEDLYQLALADAGALEYRFETFDFAVRVRDAVARRQAAFADAGLRLTADVRATLSLRGDPRRLDQLLDNLLANALRYTDAPGEVRVTLTRQGMEACLQVDDSAPGVPAKALPHLFDRLYRVDASRSRRHGGAGLGLAIVAAIVAAHDGTVVAGPSPLGGLRVEVCLSGPGGWA
jgi:two-component system sensor histidine kinase BaeS